MILEIKDSYPEISLSRFCRLLGVSRQAYYQHYWHREKINMAEEMILEQIKGIRKTQPAIGTRKLYFMLQSFLQNHKIKIGRDKLFNLLAAQHMLVRRRKRRIFTTQSFHWLRKYPNLIRSMEIIRPNQLWVADITYYRIATGHVYISLITDAYSHTIVGYHLSDNLEASNNIKALEMALSKLPSASGTLPLIHHSDRGIQYCSKEYVRILKSYDISISMTEDGNPLENAIAERINGILKQEFLNHDSIKNKIQAMEILSHAVTVYNEKRPHLSCSLLTPQRVHSENISVKKLWKSYKKKPVNLCQD